MKKFLTTLCLFLVCIAAVAQTAEPEMADLMRSEGKIYVVVAIILIILTGLFLYLFTLDKKIGQIEKQAEKKA